MEEIPFNERDAASTSGLWAKGWKSSAYEVRRIFSAGGGRQNKDSVMKQSPGKLNSEQLYGVILGC